MLLASMFQQVKPAVLLQQDFRKLVFIRFMWYIHWAQLSEQESKVESAYYDRAANI